MMRYAEVPWPWAGLTLALLLLAQEALLKFVGDSSSLALTSWRILVMTTGVTSLALGERVGDDGEMWIAAAERSQGRLELLMLIDMRQRTQVRAQVANVPQALGSGQQFLDVQQPGKSMRRRVANRVAGIAR